MSSSPLQFPSTPSSRRQYFTITSNRPLTSSPLADYSPPSPVADAQARRRSQYKSRSVSQNFSSTSATRARPLANISQPNSSAESSQKTFLRERFVARCFERARRARDRDVRDRRWGQSALSSDGLDVEMDVEDDKEDEDEDGGLNDELFRRIMSNERRKDVHAFKLSYALDVGSSIDPNMEDVGSWEAELRASTTAGSVAPIAVDDGPPPPEDLDVNDEELSSWYEEYLQEQDEHDKQTETDISPQVNYHHGMDTEMVTSV